jgi:menaquinone-specific isochorismate synthase
MCVAIRSALIQENKVHLFAGAGIVDGSVPAKEWEELNEKIRGMEHALESAHH